MSISNVKKHVDLPLPGGVTSESLRSLLSISPEALLIVNQAGILVMLNEQAETLFGYAHDELVGQPLTMLLPECLHPVHTAHLKQRFSTPALLPVGGELPLSGIHKDGTKFPTNINLMPLLLNATHCAIGAVSSMTPAQPSLEKPLTTAVESEHEHSLLKTIFSTTEEAVCLFDTQGRYYFVSESFANLFGLVPGDFLGKRWQELALATELMAPFEAQFQKAVATGQTVEDEMLVSATSGLRWFNSVAQPIGGQDGTVEAVVVAWKDISMHTQAADTVHQMASIVESSSEAILSKTLEGVVTSWNNSAEKLYGYRADEMIGQSILRLFPPHRQKELWDVLACIKEGKMVKELESMRIRKDGSIIEVSVSISPILDNNGCIIGASAIAHDITEHKRLIRELLNLNKALEEAKLVRDQFIGTMSHELRTPLASIIGFSELLLKDVPEAGMDPQQSEDMQCILRNAYHLLDLVNDVLDLEKIEERHMKITPTSVDVKRLLQALVEESKAIAAAQNIVLRAEVEEGIGYIETDQMRLQQVLLNLVSNALKFTKQGEITISAKLVAPSKHEGQCVAIAVKDSGIGIPLDKQEQIFEAFYQVDGSYTREYGGTGLGLSIVSQLTRLLGGTVAVDSTLGQGSVFTVTMPMHVAPLQVDENIPRLHPVQKESVSEPQLYADDGTFMPPKETWLDFVKQAVGKGQSNVVLVVDDDPDAITIIKRSLLLTPFVAVGVQDPSMVMDLVQTLHPCAITLDVMMPQINGWQLLYQLKENPLTAEIPVVMVSLLAEQTTGYVIGADAYLLKPFKINELVGILQRVMEPKHDALPARLPVPKIFPVAKSWDAMRQEKI